MLFSHSFLQETQLILSRLFQVGTGVFDFVQSSLVRKLPMLELMVILDGAVLGFVFAKEYVLYKVSEARIAQNKQTEYKQEVVKQCNQTYTLETLERYMMYTGVHLCHVVVSVCLSNIAGLIVASSGQEHSVHTAITTGMYVIGMGVVVPRIQNRIVKLKWVARCISNYLLHKETFLRYSVSKSIITAIQKLHPDIQEIRNYHIFVLYGHVSIEYFWDFVKAYGFIYLLNLLRGWESTYYYYKAIKFAYYYNTGYMFNTLTGQDAVYIINVIVNEKRWRDLAKIEVVNAFYSLTYLKLKNKQLDYWTDLQIVILKVFMVWSVVCVLKLFSIYVNTVTLIVYLLALWYSCDNLENYSTISVIKQVFAAVIAYVLIVLNVNDIIISLVFIANRGLYYICEEAAFYLNNRRDISKVVTFYTKNLDKKKIKSS